MNALIVMPETDVSRSVVAHLLAYAGIASDQTEATEAPFFLARRSYSLAVFGIPGEDLPLCRALREVSPEIALICISDGSLLERCALLAAGADDVIARPWEPAELVARVKAVLARCGQRVGLGRNYSCGALSLDRDNSLVSTPWKSNIALTPTERRLFDHLLINAGQVVKRDDLLTHIWGGAYDMESNPVDVYIRRLRQKIEPDPAQPTVIVSIRGSGYKLIA